jgi:hypothetical protein
LRQSSQGSNIFQVISDSFAAAVVRITINLKEYVMNDISTWFTLFELLFDERLAP